MSDKYQKAGVRRLAPRDGEGLSFHSEYGPFSPPLGASCAPGYSATAAAHLDRQGRRAPRRGRSAAAGPCRAAQASDRRAAGSLRELVGEALLCAAGRDRSRGRPIQGPRRAGAGGDLGGERRGRGRDLDRRRHRADAADAADGRRDVRGGSRRSGAEHHGRHAVSALARQPVQRRHDPDARRLQRRSRRGPQVWRRAAVRGDAGVREARRGLLPAAAGAAKAGAEEGRGRGGEVIDPRRGTTERPIFDEDDSDIADTQEFDRALSAGTELLSQGNPTDARIALEKALRYKPRNQRARNLLGLSLFKMGELPRAEEIYRSLIEDHPADPTLRVNLGLVFLKQNASADAVRCFETALDLSPDHQKAQNYLGLALSQKGDLARAREWFLKAGNDAMADRMGQALQQSPIRGVADSAADALAKEQPFTPALQEKLPKKGDTLETAKPKGLDVALSGRQRAQWVATDPGLPAAPPVAPELARTAKGAIVANAPEPSVPVATELPEPSVEPPPSMAQYASATRLAIPDGSAGFAIGASEVLIHVRGEMLTRLDGLVASWGSVTMKPELKRFRGKATDKPFGDGPRRMLRASGEGRYVISREGRQFTALELADEPAYFREEILFAFEESILFENGRVPAKSGADLHLVHLRGRGKLLLVTHGTPKAVDVHKGEPLRIPMEQLVGWHGPLIQPRLVSIVEEAPELGTALELAGEGRALVDVLPGR